MIITLWIGIIRSYLLYVVIELIFLLLNENNVITFFVGLSPLIL